MTDETGDFVLLYDDGHIYLLCPRCRVDEPLDSDDSVATLAAAIAAAEAHRCSEGESHD